MGLLDAFLGRRKPAQPSLDAFFALPSAAITVQAALDFVPTGRAGIAFRAPEGRAFHDVQSEIERLLTLDASTRVEIVEDSDRKSTRLNSSHSQQSRMPSSA